MPLSPCRMCLNFVVYAPVAAIVMGPERTRNDLIPFLNNAKNLPDEALAALADQLGSIVPVCSGHLSVLPVPSTVPLF